MKKLWIVEVLAWRVACVVGIPTAIISALVMAGMVSGLYFPPLGAVKIAAIVSAVSMASAAVAMLMRIPRALMR